MPKLKIKVLNPTWKTLSVGTLVLAALSHAHAQYTPPPPPAPFKGFLNEYLHTNFPSLNGWNFGGEWRERFVVYDG